MLRKWQINRMKPASKKRGNLFCFLIGEYANSEQKNGLAKIGCSTPNIVDK